MSDHTDDAKLGIYLEESAIIPREEELILSREIFNKVSGDVWDEDVPPVRKCLEIARFIMEREAALQAELDNRGKHIMECCRHSFALKIPGV